MVEITDKIIDEKSGKSPEPQPIVRFEQVKYCYISHHTKEHFHLGPFSTDIKDSELMVILGPSGSGKTTFLRVIAGLETPRAGTIRIGDRVMFSPKVNVPTEKRKVGMMFQDHALFPHLSVRKNILFGIQSWSKDDRDRRLFELEDLLELRDYLNRMPHELSGGQQQRVALARTLAPNPKVVLLDEPLSNIDTDLRTELAQELRDILKRTNTTAVWVTHDQTEALDIADRILVLNEGQIEQVDTPWNLYNHPKTRFVADFVGNAVFIPGEARGDAILTEIGTVQCLPCLQDVTKFEIMLRPDDVKAKPHDAGVGIVAKRQFLGPNQLYSITLPSGQQILSNQPSHINWPIGTQLQITLDIRTPIAFPVHD